ncbi:uncharacterized protein BJ171DRAFT_495194 [Polychytrium aggregatum]|uniref:uncharacterized protein n=1 Tax=Polychytrium aggregatum TaxID=110093 RepID=UPI0022FE2A96|nr:uncharacterized protein BJ171DRAFT_495194 [Polychytrium aggregatum]KAI9206934.1 hypothetical protein BJ171DRAFT_495194 [Polychytrium aggregatum]
MSSEHVEFLKRWAKPDHYPKPEYVTNPTDGDFNFVDSDAPPNQLSKSYDTSSISLVLGSVTFQLHPSIQVKTLELARRRLAMAAFHYLDSQDLLGEVEFNYVGVLQETVQRLQVHKPEYSYEPDGQKGPYICSVHVFDTTYQSPTALGKKKLAQQAAAAQALKEVSWDKGKTDPETRSIDFGIRTTKSAVSLKDWLSDSKKPEPSSAAGASIEQELAKSGSVAAVDSAPPQKHASDAVSAPPNETNFAPPPLPAISGHELVLLTINQHESNLGRASDAAQKALAMLLAEYNSPKPVYYSRTEGDQFRALLKLDFRGSSFIYKSALAYPEKRLAFEEVADEAYRNLVRHLYIFGYFSSVNEPFAIASEMSRFADQYAELHVKRPAIDESAAGS